MADMQLDVDKLPMGKIQKEQISKAYKILKQIQKVLLTEKG